MASQAGGKQLARSQSPDPSILLMALREDVQDIRSLIQCGVCVKLLYEPFTLTCGHTFCYSCLTQWFINNRRKKTCPDCRALVKSQPAPAYLIRQIVQMFTSREELLEKYETAADHSVCQRAETERIDEDKSNTDPREGGLFQGAFNEIPPAGQPIHDVDDGVDRCPMCAWELEGEECYHCGYTGGLSGSELGDFEDEFDEMDEFGDDFWEDYRGGGPGLEDLINSHVHRLPRRLHRRALDTDSNEESSEEESDDGEMSSFISDDEGHDHGTDRSTVMEDRSFMPDEMDHTSEVDDSMLHGAENPIEVDDSGEEAQTSSDDDEDVILSRNTGSRRRRQVVSTSPAPSVVSDSSSNTESIDSLENPPRSRRHIRGTRSETEESATESATGNVGTSTTNAITIDDEDDDDDDDEEDEAPIRPSRATRVRERRTRRRQTRRNRRSQELRRNNASPH
ncbi:E3 ubiquitin ligase [Arachnomyces sp. PD_36]|nr:E3 ubiquitin ligase [Arachnomyces sp. PD_36]